MAVIDVRAHKVSGSAGTCNYCKATFGPMLSVDLDVVTFEHQCLRGESQSWRFHDHYWVDRTTVKVH